MDRPRACRRSDIAWCTARARTCPPYGDRRRPRQRSYDVEPAGADRIALAGEERGHFIEREADDVGVGAHDLDDEAAGDALRRVPAGLAAPFARGEIGFDIVLRQALEAHAGLDQALPVGLLRRHQADRGVDAMIASGEKPQALRGFV